MPASREQAKLLARSSRMIVRVRDHLYRNQRWLPW